MHSTLPVLLLAFFAATSSAAPTPGWTHKPKADPRNHNKDGSWRLGWTGDSARNQPMGFGQGTQSTKRDADTQPSKRGKWEAHNVRPNENFNKDLNASFKVGRTGNGSRAFVQKLGQPLGT